MRIPFFSFHQTGVDVQCTISVKDKLLLEFLFVSAQLLRISNYSSLNALGKFIFVGRANIFVQIS